ncbi:MAG: hypothetical protein K0R71_2096 [Bacillales bacterium]|jgi:hypothetical protein|nr:hypothetical protein [Bacillales bacterium]
MKKVDYKRDFKTLYLPKLEPEIVDVPEAAYFMIEGEGDPNGEEFGVSVEALYSLSYAVKMSYKGPRMPTGYYDYTVFPLEGVWDLIDKTKPVTDKSNFKYTLMIRQPDFLSNELYEYFLEETLKKKKNPKLDNVKYVKSMDGLSIQILHRGSYDNEPASFEKMENYCKEMGYKRSCKTHREIYLSDPRKTASDKLKTVLRYKVEKI